VKATTALRCCSKATRVFGDVDGELSVGVGSAEGQFCPTTVMIPLSEARGCTVMGSTEGRGGGPAGRAPHSLRAWSWASGLGRVRSSSPGVGIEEHQRRVFDADAHAAPGEDLRRE
jgi:hypothetical protein